MSCTDCIICDGPRYLDQQDMPSCGACGPVLAAHVVSMRTDPNTGDALAVCPCGWSSRHPWSQQGRQEREAAVFEHWRSVRQVQP